MRTCPPEPVREPEIRNAPRRRYQYGWAYRMMVQRAMKESVSRLQYLEVYAPLPVCRPLSPLLRVRAATLEGGDIALEPQLFAALDEAAISTIPPQTALGTEREPLQVTPPPAMHPRLPVKAAWASMEQDRLLPFRIHPRGEGVFVPQVAVAPFQTAFVLGAGAPPAPAVQDRRGVVIPINGRMTSTPATGTHATSRRSGSL